MLGTRLLSVRDALDLQVQGSLHDLAGAPFRGLADVAQRPQAFSRLRARESRTRHRAGRSAWAGLEGEWRRPEHRVPFGILANVVSSCAELVRNLVCHATCALHYVSECFG